MQSNLKHAHLSAKAHRKSTGGANKFSKYMLGLAKNPSLEIANWCIADLRRLALQTPAFSGVSQDTANQVMASHAGKCPFLDGCAQPCVNALRALASSMTHRPSRGKTKNGLVLSTRPVLNIHHAREFLAPWATCKSLSHSAPPALFG